VSDSQADIVPRLAAVLGDEHVLTGRSDREYYAMDVYSQGEPPLAVVRPGTVPELQSIARIAAEFNVAMVPRGGSASYTNAHTPSTPHSLVIDTLRLNRIVAINEQDMYVTVEPGVTWHELWQSLKARGLRTSFWGPFSGIAATVGGSTSQNSISLGSSHYGTSADTVLGFEIVLANGEILRTGSHAAANAKPFFRWYGPDLTGLFCGDSGALGVKASITLRLIADPPFSGGASFGFDSFEQMAAGMAAAARANVSADNFGLDATLQQGQLAKVDAREAARAAMALARASRNPLEALVRLGKIALAGRQFLAASPYVAHYVTEGISRSEVNDKLAVLRRAVGSWGREGPNTVPVLLRAMPYVPMQFMLGPKGERWVPMHGVMPFSALNEFHGRIRRLFDANAERMKRDRVIEGAMFSTISTHAFLHEPVFYWEDELTDFHMRYLPADFVKGLPRYPANPPGRALVEELREEIQKIFTACGAVHFQVGKCYPYMEGRQEQAAQLLRELKRQLDPAGLMNPGALQLGTRVQPSRNEASR